MCILNDERVNHDIDWILSKRILQTVSSTLIIKVITIGQLGRGK